MSRKLFSPLLIFPFPPFLSFFSLLFLLALSTALAYAQTSSPEGSFAVYLPIISSELPEEEAILILEPGPGSRLTSPLHLSGIADPTFEQNLGIQIILVDGTVLTETFTTIQADVGERGPFSVDVPFDIAGEQQASIQVFSTSARDGGLTHLSSVFVTLADSGPVIINPALDSTERIIIHEPGLSEVISGGVVHVEGFGLASFEQHLFIEVMNEAGMVIGSAPVTVNSPDPGVPGLFSADIPYTLTTAGPGRIVVHDPSPAFPGDVHLTSVEINLEP
jgi:hypothetical protein